MKPVLLIDDDMDYLEATATLLRDENVPVYVAMDGVDGLNILATAPNLPALILLDSMMPRMSGEAFLKAMRPEHPDVAVIVVSAYDGKLPLANGMLAKPVSCNDILKVVRESCSGDSLSPEEPTTGLRLRLLPRDD